MSVSFIAKNLAGDLFHLSYDSSLKAKKRSAFLCSLLYRTFNAPRSVEVVWFVEEEAFKIPTEGQTMEVFFREPYSIRLSLVDEPSQTSVTAFHITHRSSRLWTRDQVTHWIAELDSFRSTLEFGNLAPSFHSEDEWMIETQCQLLHSTQVLLHERNVRQPDSLESLLDIQEEIGHYRFRFPATLHISLTIGSHTFVSPVYLPDGETMDATPILLALEEDNMLVRPQE